MSTSDDRSTVGGCPFHAAAGATGPMRISPLCQEPALAPNAPSGEHDLPVTYGNLLDFPDDPVRAMRSIHAAHGNIGALEQDTQRIHFVFGPELNQRVLADAKTFHSRFFAVRGPRNSAQRRLTCGLLSMNNDDHKRHRRLVMGPFQRRSVQGYGPSLSELARTMCDSWQPGTTRDMFTDMTQFMLRVTSSVLFGFDMNELAYEIGKKIERWVALNHELGIGALVPTEGFTAGYDQLMEQAEALEQQILRMIQYRRSASEPGTDVLSLLIAAHDEDGVGMTDAELIGQAAILFGAAHLTTANTLTWTLFLLSQHPEIAEPLVAELRSSLRGGSAAEVPLEQLPLLNNVIQESMRVLPASSYSQRISSEPVQLGPFLLPRGSTVIFSQFITHHMAELFDEPERFVPERWNTIKPSPYAYLPFAAGPRMCIGATLAMMTIKICLSEVLQRWQLSVPQGADINGKVLSTMLTPTTGMPMQLERAGARWHRSHVVGNIHELMRLPESQASMWWQNRAA